jgi:ribosome biogenesis protein UTP30
MIRSIKIGTTGMTSSQLLENLEVAIPAVIDKIPRKWKNIQSLHIKTPESISLPIYNCLPDLPIEIGPKDIKKENYGDGIESEIKVNDLDSDKDDDKNDYENDNTEDDDTDEDEKDEDSTDEEEEERLIKKRKISQVPRF